MTTIGVFAGEGEEVRRIQAVLFVGHTGGRFVDKEEFGFLGEQHADFEPLFLAVGEGAGFAILVGAERLMILRISSIRSRLGALVFEEQGGGYAAAACQD